MNQGIHAGGFNGHNGEPAIPISAVGVNGRPLDAVDTLSRGVNSCRKILVVEDDSDLCSLLCDLLNTEGYQTESSSDGLEAVQRVSRECPDAIVLDVMIPGLNGFDVCEKLKFSRQTNRIPILMLTALDGHEARDRGLRVGADRYLTKPFEPDALLHEIRDTIEHRRKLESENVRTAVELQMQSDSRLREQLNDLLSELFRFTPLPEEELGRIRYAALEMVQNAIEWGNHRDKNRTVRISYEVTDEMVKFVITDEGQGFDRESLPHAASDDDPIGHMEVRQKMGLREGGFGIMIARGMVDEVKYNAAGNEVTLIKYLKSSQGGEAKPA
jgi:DNA-binding response OmpR family regulator